MSRGTPVSDTLCNDTGTPDSGLQVSGFRILTIINSIKDLLIL